ncbi:YheT family hydrolase [Negadavirga shengliensis]|uniref:YheT family hydrolase n=1 Tax=Negadavirga shengliensis TaxID=1389218 RepID=A0ABV9T2B4_9BACT
MPLIEKPNYYHPFFMFNGHIQTIIPAIFRLVDTLPFERERINTPDGDFLDLDWLRNGSRHLVIISHGLEGNSRRPYMSGMAKIFMTQGYDVLTWNFRGCSEEINLKPFFYHSGATYDLQTVIDHAAPDYDDISLIGFSLGGNLTLKYLGEPHRCSPKIRKAVTISVPLDLASSCHKISSKENLIYSQRFLKTLKLKIQLKGAKYPDLLSLEHLIHVNTMRDFDDFYTGPLHGFQNAKDYYTQCSSIHFLPYIRIPTLVLNAKNDPFLSPECYPHALGKELEYIFMEFPEHGGHVGFSPRRRKDVYWSEKRAWEFIHFENYA